METSYIIKGLVIGLSVAAPVGPIGVLCIRRTLADGLSAGVISGAGAATADTVYGCIAGFGITFIASFFVGEQFWLRLFGGIFLLCLGMRTFHAKPANGATSGDIKSDLAAYASTFFLTLTNPLTILSFGAIFAGLRMTDESRGYASGIALISSVFVGSMLWWLLLCGSVSVLRKKFNNRRMGLVNKASGAIILTFGVLSLLSLIRRA